MELRTGFIYRNILGRFLGVSVLLILFPVTLKDTQATAFTLSFTPRSVTAETPVEQKSDSVSSYQYIEKPVAARNPKESIQASSSRSSATHNNRGNTTTFIVSTQVQAENMLDQGYSVNDIAKELQLSKKEVRKLKKRLKKEEKAAIQQRKTTPLTAKK